MYRVAVLDDYQRVALASADFGVLADRCEVVAFDDHLAEPDALVARLAEFDIVIAMRERTAFPATVLDRLPRLRLLVTTGARNAAIDLAAAARNDVLVCGTGMHPNSAAELAWALLQALVRHLPAEDAAIRAGGWQRTVGLDLAGRTLGLLGLGKLGQRVARYARAFEMPLLAWSQNLTAEAAEEHGAQLVGRDELFERADIVSIHLILSHRTRGLVGAEQLRLLGPAGYLVNTSRGPIVDGGALVAARSEGAIAGAALDVFDTEPLPLDHPLRSAPNTVLAPHLGYVTENTYRVMYGDAVADVDAWLRGAAVRVVG